MMRSSFFYKGGEYNFEKDGFTAHFQPEFIDSLCALTKSSKSSPKTFVGHWMALRRFLEYIKEINHSLFEHLQIDQPFTDHGSIEFWQSAIISFRGYLDQNYKSSSNKNKYLSGINFWTDLLAHKNKIPRLERLVYFRIDTVGLKQVTVADAILPSHVLDAISGADKDNRSEMSRLRANLRAVEVIGDYDCPDNFSELDFSKKSEWLLTKRLSDIRVQLESRFLEARKIRASGLVTIRAYRHLCPLIDEFLQFNGGKGHKNPKLDEIRGLTYDELRNGLLAWFWYHNGKIQLKNHDGSIYQLAAKQLNEIRKKEDLDKRTYGWDDLWFADRIGCTSRLYSPAVLLLIFDNTMNVSSATNLNLDCINDLGDVTVIEWYKRRAKSTLFKGISSKLKVSSLDVVRHIKRATKAYRDMDLLPKDKEKLFLSFLSCKEKNGDVMLPRKPDDNTFTKCTKDTLSEISNGNWFATAEMIRKSLLLLCAMSGDVLTLKAEAQHKKSRTSTVYANRAPMQAKHDVIMREFKEWLQTLVTVRISDSAEKLGVDPSKYNKQMEQIIASGFGGLVCSDPRGGAQPDVAEGELCDKVGRCLTCKNKQHVFIETVDNVMHLLMWEQALNYATESNQIDATDLNWHFWFKFIETMLSRLTDDAVENKQAIIADAKIQMSKRENKYLLIDFKAIN